MTPPRALAARRRQRGAAALAVAMVLLFAMTLVAFHAQRSLLFEQRTSANQLRATRAFELAEAGVEWATARLNDARHVDASCTPAAAPEPTLRERLLRHTAGSGAFRPAADLLPGCRLGADGPARCVCPGAAQRAAPSDEPGFAVRVAAVDGDPESVELRAAGCIGAGATCAPGMAGGGGGDARAEVRVVVKLLPTLRHAPRAALTVGGDVALGAAAVSIVNVDAATAGVTVDAGGAAPDAAAHATTVPGSPPSASVLPHDAALAAMAGTDALFRAHFADPPDAFRAARATAAVCDAAHAAARGRDCRPDALACGDARGCAAALADAVAAGHQQLWVDADLHFDAATAPPALGTPTRPLLLVVSGTLTFDAGASTLHGLLVGSAPELRLRGSGAATLHGAIIAPGGFATEVALALHYDPAVLARLRTATGTLVRVPGSWRDF